LSSLPAPALPHAQPEALVLRVDARRCEVLLASGETAAAQLRGRLFEERSEDRVPVAVGDRVRLDLEQDTWAIAEILPRRNLFCRRASGEDLDRRQLLAANVDHVVVVNSLDEPPFSSIAADRILAACSFADLPALLVLNKADLVKPRKLERILATYSGAELPLLPTSAVDERGLDELRAAIAGRVSVFYGLSGVGKSTLLNRLLPDLELETRTASAALSSGRHTTAYSRLYPLPGGGAVIDTPGVRKFRPYGLPPVELRLHFAELRRVGADCRFPNCTHRSEPGCAVLAALKTGALPEPRYRSYLELLQELEQYHGGTGGPPPPGPDHKARR
jgi:ribosome biogenesis GTPase